MPSQIAKEPAASPPWWRFGYVWLVISGPAVVVVAAFLSFGIAITQQDVVINGESQSLSVTIDPVPEQTSPQSWTPAVQGRNHAATPAQDMPSLRP